MNNALFGSITIVENNYDSGALYIQQEIVCLQ